MWCEVMCEHLHIVLQLLDPWGIVVPNEVDTICDWFLVDIFKKSSLEDWIQ